MTVLLKRVNPSELLPIEFHDVHKAWPAPSTPIRAGRTMANVGIITWSRITRQQVTVLKGVLLRDQRKELCLTKSRPLNRRGERGRITAWRT